MAFNLATKSGDTISTGRKRCQHIILKYKQMQR